MDIVVVGAGYVGLSLACLLGQVNRVCVLEVVPDKVDLINRGLAPIADAGIEEFLALGNLDIWATDDPLRAYEGADLIVVAAPTNYDDERGYFDTSVVELVIEQADAFNPDAAIVVKSTVPVGFTQKMSERYPSRTVLFSPEFLREGRALHDNLYPSRIVVGIARKEPADIEVAWHFASLLVEGAAQHNAAAREVPCLVVGSSEAEAVKLYANTYLALRVSFFNELDTYAESKGLDTSQIIEGVCLDPRIGNYYNNPSFGYGGYCLPKDSKQLLANYDDVPQNLIKAIVESNETRKQFIADQIMKSTPKLVGAFRLVMKSGSDNFRESSMLGVMERLRTQGVSLAIYEPMLDEGVFDDDIIIIRDLREFKNACDLIVANRLSEELADVMDKVVTRDLWHCD